MRFRPAACFTSALLLAASAPAFAFPHPHRGPTAPHQVKPHAAPHSAHAAPRASMTPERATEIQTALIHAGYMTGEPTGFWDAPSQAAMQKLQADNGWQTKLVPDARALNKLGLGSAATAGANLGANLGTDTADTFPASTEAPLPAASGSGGSTK